MIYQQGPDLREETGRDQRHIAAQMVCSYAYRRSQCRLEMY